MTYYLAIQTNISIDRFFDIKVLVTVVICNTLRFFIHAENCDKPSRIHNSNENAW